MASAADKKHVAQVLSQIAEQAASLPEPVLKEFLPVLVEARNSLQRDIKKWTENDGDEKFTAIKYRQALLQVEAALKELETVVPAKMEKALHGATPLVADKALEHMSKEVAMFSRHIGGVQRMSALPINRAALIAQSSAARIHRYKSSSQRYGKNMVADIRQQLAVGVVRGETFSEMTTRIAGLKGFTKKIDTGSMPTAGQIADGLTAKHRFWAERIVRTEILTSYNEDEEASLFLLEEEDPGYLKRWDATIDRTCKTCRSLDGEVVKLTEKFKYGYDKPPAHPMCRCALTPWRAEWGESKVSSVEEPPKKSKPAKKAAKPKPVEVAPTPKPPAPPPAPSKSHSKTTPFAAGNGNWFATKEQADAFAKANPTLVKPPPKASKPLSLDPDDYPGGKNFGKPAPKPEAGAVTDYELGDWVEDMQYAALRESYKMPRNSEEDLYHFDKQREKEFKRVDAIAHYTGEGYTPVNQLLRIPERWHAALESKDYFPDLLKRTQDTIATLDEITERYKTPRAAVVYRGTDITGWGDKLKPGARFVDRGFVSTTNDPAIAKGVFQGGDRPAFFEIEVPAGKGAIPIGNMSKHTGEGEIVLERDTEFRVLDVSETKVPGVGTITKIRLRVER